MTLAQRIGTAIDRIFAENEALRCFERWDAKDGMSLRRYYAATPYSEREVSIYRDKWWTKDGGTIRMELYCLAADVQLAFTGVEQRWRALDYTQPIAVLQYRLGAHAVDAPLEWTIRSSDDLPRLGADLARWLPDEGLRWFGELDHREGVQIGRAHV